MHTPSYVVNNYPPDSLKKYIVEGIKMNPLDFLGGINAMLTQDIYKTSETDINGIKNVIKTELMIIVAKQDHIVNPISATSLAEKLNIPLVKLTGNCGHIGSWCESEKVKKAVDNFLD